MIRKLLLTMVMLACVATLALSQSFTFESVKSYPFPNELVASATGSRIAWAANIQGKRNVFVAEGPDFKARQLTSYANDDGQEITSLQISPDGKWVVFVRGGDHGSNWDEAAPINPTGTPEQIKVQIFSVPFSGGDPKMLSEGDEPSISPKNDVVAFIKNNQPWVVSTDGVVAAKSLFVTRGTVGSLEWSGDGSQLAFVSSRGDHAFIGVYKDANTPIQWVAPSFSRDYSPRWSPDGKKIAFIRTPGSGGAPDSLLTRKHNPWSIWTTELATGNAQELYRSPATLRGSVPTTHGGTNLHWPTAGTINFLSYKDGWPHLYAVGANNGKEILLTPGNFMVEHVRLSPDKKWLIFSANTGPDEGDLDRRHAVRVAIDKPGVEVMTPGNGLEWTPVITGDGSSMVFISAKAQRPPIPGVISLNSPTKGIKLIGEELIPTNFPTSKLVTPKKVTFKASDGVTVHADLFEPANGASKKPAILYIHGGPPRQMLLGWHYSDYYSNAYATNQYLTSLGFVVLSVNYRLGIGYGYEFHQPANAGRFGASEYLDVKAAGEWLSKQSNVDASRIGVYGGSYGGFLTAHALARDSKLFAAGVDIHGVHDYSMGPSDRYEKAPDYEEAFEVTWKSSPIAYVSTWTSPVLIIHGDDDRNVRFNQSTDLVKRLDKKGVSMETMVIVDDTHHWMKHSNSLMVGGATADFFVRKFLKLQ